MLLHHRLLLLAALLLAAGLVYAFLANRRLRLLLQGVLAGAGDWAKVALRQARRAVVLIVGGSVALAGVVLIFTPGPALVVIPVGLSILAVEFAWARRWLKAIKAKAEQLQRETFAKGGDRGGEPRK